VKYGLQEDVIQKINHVFLSYLTIEKCILYGSRAKGNYKNGSDIDLTLIGNELSLSVLHAIHHDLDELLLPYTFDLSLHHRITSVELILHIKDVGIVFYSRSSIP